MNYNDETEDRKTEPDAHRLNTTKVKQEVHRLEDMGFTQGHD